MTNDFTSHSLIDFWLEFLENGLGDIVSRLEIFFKVLSVGTFAYWDNGKFLVGYSLRIKGRGKNFTETLAFSLRFLLDD